MANGIFCFKDEVISFIFLKMGLKRSDLICFYKIGSFIGNYISVMFSLKGIAL